ncbi:hypothetical protein C1646_772762 [Rhizophagus diaphanus]|nr:hypothetical protein C1646_772762 [Rhizophagus diaphanus] [Rhizophagus sp. MUCL 43196]
MSAITTKFVTDHQLTNEMSIEELSLYAPEMHNLLGDNREKRCQAHNHLQKGYKFSKGQAFALIPNQKIEQYISQVLILEELGLEAEVNISLVSENAPEELQTLNVPEKIISATKILEITRVSNKIQQEHTEQRKNEGLHYPDHFSLELVKEWLDLYVVSNTPDKQALADEAISFEQLRNLEKPGSIYLSSFLKKDEYIPKPYEPLLSNYLCKLEAVFASVVHEPKNLSKANTYASEALCHCPDNHTSLYDRYTIINFRRRGQPYDQAKSFWISDEN